MYTTKIKVLNPCDSGLATYINVKLNGRRFHLRASGVKECFLENNWVLKNKKNGSLMQNSLIKAQNVRKKLYCASTITVFNVLFSHALVGLILSWSTSLVCYTHFAKELHFKKIRKHNYMSCVRQLSCLHLFREKQERDFTCSNTWWFITCIIRQVTNYIITTWCDLIT